MTMGQAMQGVPPSRAGHSACCARTVGAEGSVLAWKCGSSIQVPEDISNRELCCDNTSWTLPAQCCHPKHRCSLKTLRITCLKNELGVGSIQSMSKKLVATVSTIFLGFISWQVQWRCWKTHWVSTLKHNATFQVKLGVCSDICGPT